MRIIITEKQLEFIESKRKYLGGGIHHKVYTVVGDENTIVKIGRIEDIKFYVEQFIAHTDIFPKIYKHGTFTPSKKKFKSYGKQEKLGYVYIEKLDIDLFYKKFKYLKYFDFGDYQIEKDWRNSLIAYFANPDITYFDNVINDFISKADEDDKKFFFDLLGLIGTIHKLCDDGEICVHHDFDSIDLHEGNFGIDNNGKIKCLDF